jgi:hypothetical protein
MLSRANISACYADLEEVGTGSKSSNLNVFFKAINAHDQVTGYALRASCASFEGG